MRWSSSFSTWRGQSEWETALGLLSAGRLKPEPIITHHFPLDRVADAFAAADDKRSSGAIRVMVCPGAETRKVVGDIVAPAAGEEEWEVLSP